jgi:hypothetical protein
MRAMQDTLSQGQWHILVGRISGFLHMRRYSPTVSIQIFTTVGCTSTVNILYAILILHKVFSLQQN